MPLNVAMQQPDRDKFIAAMAHDLGQQWNSSTGRSSTSLKSQRMPDPLQWYGLSSANATLQEKS